MAKDKNTWILILVIVGILFVFGMYFQKQNPIFSITGNEIMTRTIPTSLVSQGSTFSLTYAASSTTGTWGASVDDSVSGGCTFVSGSGKTLMMSTSGQTKTVIINTPSSKATCTFPATGSYQFGEAVIKYFAIQIVNVCTPICTRPADLCVDASTVSNGCTGYCSGSQCFCTGIWTVTRNTPADIECNNLVSDTELITYGNSWIGGSVTRSQLASAIVAWIGTG